MQIITNLLIFIIISSTSVFGVEYKPKSIINGSGLKVPRMVSLKESVVYMRSGPGYKYPIKLEFRKKYYPVKIVREFNNWRKVVTSNNITGWIHTQLLSSFKSGLILQTTLVKKLPSLKSKSTAKLLPNLLIEIMNCNIEWCKISIIDNETYKGWIKKNVIWGSTKK